LNYFKYDGYSEKLLYKDALKFEKICNEIYSSRDMAKKRAKKEYKKIMKEFISKLKKYSEDFHSKSITLVINGIKEKYSVNEILTQWHWRVQSVIDVYQYNLKNFRNKNLWKDCVYKRKKKIYEQQIYEKLVEQYENNF